MQRAGMATNRLFDIHQTFPDQAIKWIEAGAGYDLPQGLFGHVGFPARGLHPLMPPAIDQPPGPVARSRAMMRGFSLRHAFSSRRYASLLFVVELCLMVKSHIDGRIELLVYPGQT
jgi:hypothetical protein